MINRLDLLNKMRAHAYLSRDFTKLNDAEVAWIEGFIESHRELTADDYAQLINRLTIDDPIIRPKNRTRVWALLLEAVTIETIERKLTER